MIKIEVRNKKRIEERVFTASLSELEGVIYLNIHDEDFNWSLIKVIEDRGRIRLERCTGLTPASFYLTGTAVEVK